MLWIWVPLILDHGQLLGRYLIYQPTMHHFLRSCTHLVAAPAVATPHRQILIWEKKQNRFCGRKPAWAKWIHELLDDIRVCHLGIHLPIPTALCPVALFVIIGRFSEQWPRSVVQDFWLGNQLFCFFLRFNLSICTYIYIYVYVYIYIYVLYDTSFYIYAYTHIIYRFVMYKWFMCVLKKRNWRK